MRIRGATRLGVLAIAIVLGASACGDDGGSDTSAADQVCDARADLDTAVQKVIDDVTSLNFGAARDAIGDARSSLDELVTAVRNLADEEREKIAPDVTQLQADLSSLDDVNSIDDLGTALGNIQSKAEAALSSIESDLNCG
jgi:hypothetical protein